MRMEWTTCDSKGTRATLDHPHVTIAPRGPWLDSKYPYFSYRHTALKLKWALTILISTCLISNTYAGLSVDRVGQVLRLKGPPSPTPVVSIGSSKQGCSAHETVDLVLKFQARPDSWLDAKLPEPSSGPCNIVARPTTNGAFEIRLSYLIQNPNVEMKTLSLLTSQGFVVDHWFASTQKTVKKIPAKSEKKIKVSIVGSIEIAVLNGFDDTESWNKILGASASARDMSTLDLNLFRSPGHEKNLLSQLDPVERMGLRLPTLELPPMDKSIEFSEEEFEIPEFEGSGSRKVKAVTEGLNYVTLLVKGAEWLKARKALEVLENSEFSAALPLGDARYWAMKGRINYELGRKIKEPLLVSKGLEIWRDGLKIIAGHGGASQDYVEYMMIETVRHLFESGSTYAALSLLSWGQRLTWSTRAEERFSYLKGEAYLNLGLFDEALKTFKDYYSERSLVPLTAAVDRRLIPAAAFRIGDIEFKRGKYQEAVLAYTKAMNSMPIANRFTFEGNWYPDAIRQFPYVLFNRAEASVRINHEQDALKDLRAFLHIAGSHPNLATILYRIGDLLNLVGAPSEQVAAAWRECIFKFPDTFGARLCSARKAGTELVTAKKENWPRIIATVEDARPKKMDRETMGILANDLYTYVDLILAQAFIEAKRPTQAVFRLDPLYKHDQSAYMRAWLDEYMLTSFSGMLEERFNEGKYKEIISEYERRRKALLYKQTRPEILWNVMRANEGLGLWSEALQLLNTAEAVAAKINRKVSRPFDPKPEEWIQARVRIGLKLLADAKMTPENLKPSIEKLDPKLGSTQRYWVNFYHLSAQPKGEVKAWQNIESLESLSWTDVKDYSEALGKTGDSAGLEKLLESRIGVWFSEKDKQSTISDPPPVGQIFELYDVRFRAKKYAQALTVLDYLASLDSAKLSEAVTKPMLAFRRGETLRVMGRFDDARQSFERAKTLAPESLWGKLATSAQKEMDTRNQGPQSL